MTKSNIVEKIDNIITKIEETKNLSDKEARKFLLSVGKDLAEIKKIAEEKQKGIVDKGVKEIREKINKELSDEDLGWGEIKTFLNDDVKDDLEELKNEIVKSEEVQTIPTIMVNREREEELEKELAEWKKLFPKQSPEQVAKKQEELLKGWAELQEKIVELQEIQKEMQKVAKKSNSSTFSDFADKMSSSINGENGLIMSCTKAGEKTMPLVGTGVGALGGGTWSIAYWLASAGVFFADKGVNVVEDARKDAKDFAGKIVEVGAEGFENIRGGGERFAGKIADNAKDLMDKGMDNLEKFRGGAENLVGKGMDNTKEVISKNLELAEKAVEGGIGLQYGMFKVGIGVGKDATVEAKLEAAERFISQLEKQVAEKGQEIKQQLERNVQELGKKDQRISELEKLQIVQQTNQREDNKHVLDRLFGVVEVVAKGKDNSSMPSRPSTPPPSYNKQ